MRLTMMQHVSVTRKDVGFVRLERSMCAFLFVFDLLLNSADMMVLLILIR